MSFGKIRLRFSLRMLLCVVFVVAVVANLEVSRYRRQAAVARAILQERGIVFCEPRFTVRGAGELGAPPAAASTYYAFHNIVEVMSSGRDSATVDAIAALGTVRTLNLGGPGCRLSEADISTIAKLHQLESLSLGWIPISRESLRLIGQMRQLTELNLDHSSVGDDDIGLLRSLPNLKYLGLSATEISDRGIARIAKSWNLSQLHLNGTRITDQGLRTLEAMPSLEYLDVQWTEVTYEGIKRLEQKLPGCEVIYD